MAVLVVTFKLWKSSLEFTVRHNEKSQNLIANFHWLPKYSLPNVQLPKFQLPKVHCRNSYCGMSNCQKFNCRMSHCQKSNCRMSSFQNHDCPNTVKPHSCILRIEPCIFRFPFATRLYFWQQPTDIVDENKFRSNYWHRFWTGLGNCGLSWWPKTC